MLIDDSLEDDELAISDVAVTSDIVLEVMSVELDALDVSVNRVGSTISLVLDSTSLVLTLLITSVESVLLSASVMETYVVDTMLLVNSVGNMPEEEATLDDMSLEVAPADDASLVVSIVMPALVDEAVSLNVEPTSDIDRVLVVEEGIIVVVTGHSMSGYIPSCPLPDDNRYAATKFRAPGSSVTSPDLK